ncbi:CsiV family protein [Marinicella litoralis]|uniref:Peptidoglycan-binding protein CsiV n=1 Tax=Marinicella litoralis TaxID=644220 RepID=A0A4R6XMX4_9GAMM|nr:CsiV family protein [Marinicella litoralis]TDR17458.1 peptidoglycan-binding protein CsiV [Marinicella litoralis]
MKKILVSLICVFSGVDAQEYIQLTDQNQAYDVEVIVFARNLSQPNANTIKPQITDLDVVTKDLYKNSSDLPLFISTATEEPTVNNENVDENWQVPLNDNAIKMEALVWLYISQNMSHPVIERLKNNPIITPLFHQKWRQPATDFLSPVFVAVSNIKTKPATSTDAIQVPQRPSTQAIGDYEPRNSLNVETVVHPDFSFEGVVSFSKQRYTHFQAKINYYRLDEEGQQLIYSINQKTRVELGHWQYFDHQQFGVLAKVTPVENVKNEVSQ